MSSEAALALVHQDPAQALMPVLSVELAVERHQAVVKFVKTLMNEGHDFGKIQGTDKPTLLKPGAEKLTTFFGLAKRFHLAEKVEDWSGADHGGEPFFYYSYRCALYNGELLIAESDGSCNSFEKKYRWRKAERQCPVCGEPAIIKGREEYGGGWICFAKKGGCGGKFSDGDPEIENQQVGRIPNPDVCDLVNTLQKMAQKRAFVAATLLAVNASEFFTQDVEDLAVEEANGDARPAAQERKTAASGGSKQQSAQSNGKSAEEKAIDEALMAHCVKEKGKANASAFFNAMYGKKTLEQKRAIVAALPSTAASAATSQPAPAPPAQDVVEGELVEDDPTETSRDPRPKTLGDLVTPKQLWMIRNLARETGLDAEQECFKRFRCNLEEISKRAATELIDYLKPEPAPGLSPARLDIENLLDELHKLGCAPDEVNAKISRITNGIYAVDEIAEEHLPKVRQMLSRYAEMGVQAAAEIAKEFKPKEGK